MKAILPAVLAMALGAIPALARDGLPMPPPGGMIVTPDGLTVISSDLCGKLSPDAVPGAAYKPGVDVNGKPVAPADLPAAPARATNFPIEVKLDLRKHAGAPEHQGGAIFAFLNVRDGQAYFNGEPLTEDETGAIIAACKAAKP